MRLPAESESIFDEYNKQSPSLPDVQQAKNQDKKATKRAATEFEDPQSESEKIIAKTESEARELGVDLSFLYTHKKPTEVIISQKRLIVDILKKQKANKDREARYRKMGINKQNHQREFKKNQAQFKEKKELLDDTIMQMQKV